MPAVVRCHVVRLTESAALLRNEDEDEEWVPLSLIEESDDLEVGEEQDVSIRTWKAEQMGWS